MANELKAKWGVHAKEDPELNAVFFISLIAIFILRFL